MTKPEMKEITGSTNIAAVGHVNETLFIRFTDGAEYAYKNVPANIFNALLSAGSPGKYFHAQIKDQFESEKLEGTGNVTGGASADAITNAPANIPESEIAKSPEVQNAQQSTGAPAPIVDDAGKDHPMMAGEGNAQSTDAAASPQTDGQSGADGADAQTDTAGTADGDVNKEQAAA